MGHLPFQRIPGGGGGFVFSYDADVAKLVGTGHGVVVEQAGRGHPAGVRVIGEDDELVLVASVAHPEEALLDVGDDHALADGVDARHQVGDVLNAEGQHGNTVLVWLFISTSLISRKANNSQKDPDLRRMLSSDFLNQKEDLLLN